MCNGNPGRGVAEAASAKERPVQYRNVAEDPRPASPIDINLDMNLDNLDAAPGGVTTRAGQRAAGPSGAEPWWRPGAPPEFPSDGPIDCWTDDPDDDVDVEVLPTAGP